MKFLTSLLLLLSFTSLYSCNRSDVGDDDEITIERQEDYNREDASDTEVIPVHSDDEMKLQGEDEVDVDD